MKYILLKNQDMPTQEFDWGSLTWYASKELSNGDYTTGICRIKPGKENMVHFHPGCVETLHVRKGKIVHSIGEEFVEMNEGDTITVFEEIPHNAKNIGDCEAELLICFSTGERKTFAI